MADIKPTSQAIEMADNPSSFVDAEQGNTSRMQKLGLRSKVRNIIHVRSTIE